MPILTKFLSMPPYVPERNEMPKSGAAFRTTHWTIVLAAAQGDGAPAAHEALARLCSVYWYPLYAFCRREGRPPHDAEDLIQGFFGRIIEKNALANVRPERGRFRSFLLASLKNYVSNERDRENAQRRGGGSLTISLDGVDLEKQYAIEPSDQMTPEMVFERGWAWTLLEQAMNALRSEYAADQKDELFEQLEGFLPGGRGTIARAEIAAKRGVSVGAIDVAVHRLRQRFGALLRAKVSETVSSDTEVTDEIRHLMSILGR
jgi:RNA polymerase sigma factor (sigma-70 family)